jgi:iron complex outermembrane receptor protein
LNQAFLGGVTLFSVGGRYAVNNMVWQLNVDNAADKRYWAGAARAWRPAHRV